ncbi:MULTISPECIES: hypothetical protein [Bacillus]|uniref:hypothetical protein n=1 Tax=Bacillus TaxID=1386 RepID=UPI00061A37A7|nr:hypothetical protein [Bacillus altitudinis]MCA0926153.1 hypothetical protein [Bacillus stratosphericus]MDH8711696.1 putative membrane protein [Micromonospora sp. 1209]BAT47523.1 uncharacterized protein BTUAT1_03890 [Bacillus pumilus]AKC64845.1 hypothetical protein VT48_01900 [Bacillus altitudinis]AKU31207.1 hypothetical protein ID12_07095 [Bacillus altitudinis]
MELGVKNRLFAISGLSLIFTLTLTTMILLTLEPVTPFANLVANYPQIPGWAITSISAILNAAGTVGAIAAVLGTFGLGVIASLVVNYAKKYGIKYAISF